MDLALGQRQMASKHYLEQRKLECAAPNHDLSVFPSVAKHTGRRAVSVFDTL